MDYDDNPGGRPKKHASAADRQAAYRARGVPIEFRADDATAGKLIEIAAALDVSRAELLLSMVKFALTNHDWARFGLTHKTIPRYEGNPMATRAQMAARKRFAEMAKSGALAKKRKAASKTPARRAANPAPVKRKIPTVVYQVLTRKPRGAFVADSIHATVAAAKAKAQAIADAHPSYSVRVDSFSVKS